MSDFKMMLIIQQTQKFKAQKTVHSAKDEIERKQSKIKYKGNYNSVK